MGQALKFNTVSYAYGNSAWGDLLTNYNGTTINYDAIGNPTNWLEATNLTWNARELQSLTVTAGPTVAYEYNSAGIRTKKTVGGMLVHQYTLDGSKIIRETVTNNGTASYDLYYLYDKSGSVIGFIYNNTYYYFQKNLQGDVIRILDYNGNVVVEYTYDAWGKVLSVTGSLANTLGQRNPFRYRSYYYDTETGFYYLQSRYYDPIVGRFLNADAIIGANGGVIGYNMFAYCNNNPIMYSDPNGECFGFIEEIIECLKKILEKVKNVIEFYNMSASDSAIDLIIDYETFTEYKIDEGPYGTIGYGHSAYHNNPNDPYSTRDSITREEARDLLIQDVNIVEDEIKRYAMERNIILTQQQYDAYVVYAYNTGPGRVPDVMDLILAGQDPFTAFNYRLDMQKEKYKKGLYRRWYDSADIYVYGNYIRDYPELP